MKTRKAVYLLQGNTSHVYPIAYLLDIVWRTFAHVYGWKIIGVAYQ